MTISEVVAELQAIHDEHGDVDVRFSPDYRYVVTEVEFVEGFEKTQSGGGWDTSHVQLHDESRHDRR